MRPEQKGVAFTTKAGGRRGTNSQSLLGSRHWAAGLQTTRLRTRVNMIAFGDDRGSAKKNNPKAHVNILPNV